MDYEQEVENLESEGVTKEEIEGAKTNPPEKPEFPFLIFMLAATKDIVDWVGLSVGGMIANVIVIPIMFFHYRGKASYVKRQAYKRMTMAVIVGFIPVVNMFVPEWSLFVIMTYLKGSSLAGKLISLHS